MDFDIEEWKKDYMNIEMIYRRIEDVIAKIYFEYPEPQLTFDLVFSSLALILDFYEKGNPEGDFHVVHIPEGGVNLTLTNAIHKEIRDLQENGVLKEKEQIIYILKNYESRTQISLNDSINRLRYVMRDPDLYDPFKHSWGPMKTY